MMICEKCEQELPGGSVICRTCNHNNVLQRIDSWREKRTERLSAVQKNSVSGNGTAQQQHVALTHLKTKPKDGTLIPFPKQTQPAPAEKPPAELPQWRRQLNSRLQEIREQRAAEIEPPAAPKVTPINDRNPIVEAALNRIQRANYLENIPPIHARGGAQAALAPDYSSLQAEALAAENKAPAFTAESAPTITKAPTPLVRTAPMFTPAEEPLELESLAFVEEEKSAPEEYVDESFLPEEFPAEATPGTKTVLEAASLRLRLASAVIDAEIIAFSFLPLFAVFAFFGGRLESKTAYLAAVATVCLIALYFFLAYALAGRTAGMALLKLHLASLSPAPESITMDAPTTTTFTFKQAAMRALGGTISLLCFPINLLCLIRSYDRLSISDYLSDTQIVRIKK